jgi:hypothetical protein
MVSDAALVGSMTGLANTPTHEPYDEPLTSEQRASIAVRHSAASAKSAGVPLALALAEVRFAYGLGVT